MKTETEQTACNAIEVKKQFISESNRIIQQTLERLGEQLEKGMTEEMRHYLHAMALFHRYSIGNQFLILLQFPRASRIAGFRTWQRFHRHVKKGEKGIKILAPCWVENKQPKEKVTQPPEDADHEETTEDAKGALFFRVQYVFDVSQTSGAELPTPTIAKGDAGICLPILEKHVRTLGIDLEYQSVGTAYGISRKNEIIIRPGMPSAETFSTLVHELTHVMMHHGLDNTQLSHAEQELEADSVACVVCSRFGIDSIQASSDYILNWNGDKKALQNQLERIRQCSAKIIEGMENICNLQDSPERSPSQPEGSVTSMALS